MLNHSKKGNSGCFDGLLQYPQNEYIEKNLHPQ